MGLSETSAKVSRSGTAGRWASTGRTTRNVPSGRRGATPCGAAQQASHVLVHHAHSAFRMCIECVSVCCRCLHRDMMIVTEGLECSAFGECGRLMSASFRGSSCIQIHITFTQIHISLPEIQFGNCFIMCAGLSRGRWAKGCGQCCHVSRAAMLGTAARLCQEQA